MNTRDDIIGQAVHECFKEMYAKAQPSVDYDDLVEKFRSGEITEDVHDRIHDRYYLSMEEFVYIRDKYLDMYRMRNQWRPNIGLLKEYFTKGGLKDSYVKEKTDENGNYIPGYRCAKEVPNLKILFLNALKDKLKFGNELREPIAEELYNVVLENIDNCLNFYCFDREESQFGISVALGASPTSNKDTVIEYWKSQGIELTIEDRNPLLLWEMDEYGDEFETVMEDEYGENWKEYWWGVYEEEKREKEEIRRKKLQEIIDKNSLAQNLQEEQEKGGNDEQL